MVAGRLIALRLCSKTTSPLPLYFGGGAFLAEVGRAFRVRQTANSRVQNFEPGPSWVFYGYTAHVEEWSPGG